jgi:hypothetical protein
MWRDSFAGRTRSTHVSIGRPYRCSVHSRRLLRTAGGGTERRRRRRRRRRRSRRVHKGNGPRLRAYMRHTQRRFRIPVPRRDTQRVRCQCHVDVGRRISRATKRFLGGACRCMGVVDRAMLAPLPPRRRPLAAR